MANKFVRKYNYEKIKDICNEINFSLLETKDSFDLKYKNTMSKIKVKCNNCQKESEVQINNLINKARYNKYPCLCYYKYTREDFLKKAKEIHGDKYDYSLITEEWWQKNYKNVYTKIPVRCRNCNRVYKISLLNHIHNNQGCKYCTSSKGEQKISQILDKLNIKYIREYYIPNTKLRLDFFIPKYKIAIEFDGPQHFSNKFNHHKVTLKEIKKRDFLKNKLCYIYGINLIRIPYWDYDNLENYLNKVLKIK